jgi:hypothetical protein
LETNFRGSFGVGSIVTSHLWEYLNAYEVIDPRTKPIHLLWALFFLKTYVTEEILTQVTGATEKTIRGKIWHILYGITKIYDKVVSVHTG